MDSRYETRLVTYGGLVCPNPRETYLHTRSYDQIKTEYELLNINKFTDEEAMQFALSIARYRANHFHIPLWPILVVEIAILCFYSWVFFS